ncbi:hypothetical protein O1L60_41250 [Streptomyces diastatochromogenes]|nr:hypothetical protein [Streptomyces diastatochromogenes]
MRTGAPHDGVGRQRRQQRDCESDSDSDSDSGSDSDSDSDPMILPRYLSPLVGPIPQAWLKIHLDSAPGFPFQHHAEFAADVDAFFADPQ